MSHPHPELGTPPPLARRRPANGRARRPRRDRPQHDGVRARRPAARGGLRRLVPGGGPARHRPDPAGLLLARGPAGPDRRARADARARGSHRRGAVPAAAARRYPAGRVQAHARAGQEQAHRAPDRARGGRGRRGRAARSSGRGAWSSSRSTTRSRTRSPSRSRPRPGWCCTPATSRWTSCRWTAGCTDLGGFARLGAEGVDLLLADSTNAEVPGIVTSERDIGPVLSDVFEGAEQRIIVSCFASHVHRVQQVMDAAAEHGRKVALVGRSMVRNMGVARDLGYLKVPSVHGGLLVDLKEAEEMPPDQIVLISTGSQGEPMSALSRMAGRDHPIRIAEGDTVILASSLVPGNESAVSRIINELTRLGARVVHKGNALVHVSGHAPAGELLYVLNLVRPSNFIPVHGEWRHLKAHADLAALTGVPAAEHRDRRGRRRGRPGRRADLGRRQGAVRLRLRGRPVGRRDHRGVAQGPADPRRRGVHLGRRGGGLDQRQAGRRPRGARPRGRASTTPAWPRSSRWSRRHWPAPPGRGSPRLISFVSSFAGQQASG